MVACLYGMVGLTTNILKYFYKQINKIQNNNKLLQTETKAK